MKIELVESGHPGSEQSKLFTLFDEGCRGQFEPESSPFVENVSLKLKKFRCWPELRFIEMRTLAHFMISMAAAWEKKRCSSSGLFTMGVSS